MDPILPYLLPLFLLPLSLYLLSILRKTGSRDRNNLPPGSSGWPIIGETVAFVRLGPEKFVKERMEKYSCDVFQTSLLGEKMVVFCGAQGNKFLFTNESKVAPWLPQSLRKALMMPESGDGYLKHAATFRRILGLMLEGFKQDIPVMDAAAREHLDRERRRGPVVRIFPLSKNYAFQVTCRLLLGVVDPVLIKKLFDPITTVTQGMLSLPVDLPGTPYNRAMKAGKMVGEELIRIIKNRRKDLTEKTAAATEGGDMLSKVVMIRDGDGKFLSDLDIAIHFVGVLVASFDTTSSTITCVCNYLAQLPHIYDRVFEEQMAIAKSKGPGEPLTWEDIQKMKYSWNVARESLRLMPAAPGTFGEAITEFTYAGLTIPKGWKTFWTVHSTHKNPSYFPEPEKFDPSRFEGSGPPPYAFTPFGGGPRICPGRDYARLEVLVFMYNVVTRFKLMKTIPDEKMVFYSSPMPVHGLPLRLLPHQD